MCSHADSSLSVRMWKRKSVRIIISFDLAGWPADLEAVCLCPLLYLNLPLEACRPLPMNQWISLPISSSGMVMVLQMVPVHRSLEIRVVFPD